MVSRTTLCEAQDKYFAADALVLKLAALDRFPRSTHNNMTITFNGTVVEIDHETAEGAALLKLCRDHVAARLAAINSDLQSMGFDPHVPTFEPYASSVEAA